MDDHTLFREGLSLVLQGVADNCTVHQAENGEGALNIVEQLIAQGIDIDIVLLDYNLPDIDGIKLMSAIKKIDSSLPIAILSGENDNALFLHCIESGASGFITKNISTESMLAAILKILSGEIFKPDSSLINDGESDNNTNKILDFKVNQKTEQMRLNMQNLLKTNLELNVKSSIDALTGIPNRRNVDEFIDDIWLSSKNNQTLIGIAIIDADFFKKVNDKFGHEAGDVTLIEIARLLALSTQNIASRVGRYGGEEFVAIFHDKPKQQILDGLEKFRSELESLDILYNELIIKITVSIGLAVMVPTEDSQIRNLVRLADKNLYKAKENGRNNIVGDYFE